MSPYREKKKVDWTMCQSRSGTHPSGVGDRYQCLLHRNHFGFHRTNGSFTTDDIQWSRDNSPAQYLKRGYTDYPILFLGDTPDQPAPIRKVKVISWDGDKYAIVHVPTGHFVAIKAGYIYSESGRLGEVPQLDMTGVSIESITPPEWVNPYYP